MCASKFAILCSPRKKLPLAKGASPLGPQQYLSVFVHCRPLVYREEMIMTVKSPEALERRRVSKKAYWKVFTQKNKRVQGTSSNQAYREIERIALSNKRSVFQQIWLESCAYREQEQVPSKEVEAVLNDLYRQLRGMANNINQLAHKSNAIGRLVEKQQTKKLLLEVERFLEDFVRDPFGKEK